MSSFPPAVELNRRSYSTNAIFQENGKLVKNRPNVRSTKNTEKLVIFPPVAQKKSNIDSLQSLNAALPENLADNQMTEAERISKEQRKEHPRVTSYCIADGLKIDDISR